MNILNRSSKMEDSYMRPEYRNERKGEIRYLIRLELRQIDKINSYF